MSMNYMADVAKLLGVELGEEFNLVDKDGKPAAYNPFHIEAGGVMDCYGDNIPHHLESLLIGTFEIVKKPWKPKEKEIYYSICMDGSIEMTEFWPSIVEDALSIRAGNFFKTREEAEANVDKFLEYINQEPDLSWRVK